MSDGATSIVLNPRGTLSKALAELNAEGGPRLSIPSLAVQVDVPVDWLYQLDRGQLGVADLAQLERLCRILGRSPNDVLGYEPDI